MSKSNSNNSIMNEKFVLELNGALAMENAGLERLQTRIEETRLPAVKQQLQHHLQETTEHQKRLQQLIIDMGGQATEEKLGLPLPKFPQDMLEKMNSMMTQEELELKMTEADLIIENAELGCYHMLIQKAKTAGGQFQTAEDILSLNIQDEAKMRDWIWSNTSSMLRQLQPKI
jgi:ferritin-like metal-binding protein YciE